MSPVNPNVCAVPLILKSPVKFISPSTSNSNCGFVLLIPVLPLFIIVNLSEPAVLTINLSTLGNPNFVSVSPVCVI